MKYDEICNLPAEAGIIATLITHPEFYFSNDLITPHHFFNKENGFLFYAISELIKRGTTNIDVYNITMVLESDKATIGEAKGITAESLFELVELNKEVCRDTVEEYTMLVESVLEMSMRRDVYKKLQECERWVCNDGEENIQSKIYSAIESIVCDYQDVHPLKLTSGQTKEIWKRITRKVADGDFIDFMLSEMNKYAKLSRKGCFVIAANEKRGKSIFLMNELIDLLKKGKKVLYIDTEIDTDEFIMRCIAHLAQVDFKKIEEQTYNAEEKTRIDDALLFLEDHEFIHENHPILTTDSLISIAKQAKHKFNVDVVIVDYLKSNNEFSMDAFKNSAYMGKMTDVLKNILGTKENMFTLTAVQANPDGSIADSKKIIRNCTSLFYLERKSESQILADGGKEYGNMYMRCVANRRGMLSGDKDYISLTLDGNKCTFYVSKQPTSESPF